LVALISVRRKDGEIRSSINVEAQHENPLSRDFAGER
jgi:hypothetical protein